MLRLTPNPILRPPPDQEQRELTRRTTLRRPSGRQKLVSALQSRNALKEIAELPGAEESLHVVCRGNFPLWMIVPAVLAMAAPAVIDRLHMATLSFSKQNAADLLDLLDAGKVRSVAIVASNYFERQSPAEWGMMFDGLTQRHHRIVAIRSHAKVIAMQLSDGRGFAVESSANLRSCRNIEQMALTQSPDLARFHASWIDEVIDAAGNRGKADE